MSKRILILLLAALPFPASAQNAASARAAPISLENYRSLALSNNLSILTAQNDVQKSKMLSAQAWVNYFPKLSFSGAAVLPNLFGFANAGVSGDINLQRLFDGAVTVNSAKIKLDESIDFDDSAAAWFGSLILTQTVFAGGRIFNSNKLAKIGESASYYKLKMAQNEIYAESESKYYQFLLIRDLIETLGAYSKLLDALYSQVSDAYRAGAASKSDFLRVSLKKDELSIELDQATEAAALAERDFWLFAGIKSGAYAPPIRGDEPSEPDFAAEAGAISGTTAQRPELQLLTIQRNAARLERSIALGAYLPSVELGLALTRAGFRFNGNVFTNTNMWYYDLAGFLLFKVPISGWWEGYYKEREYALEVKSAEQRLEINSAYLELDIQNKQSAYKTAYRQVLLARSALQYAQLNLEESKEKYEAGISVLAGYLEAAALEYESRAKLDRANANFFLARTAFRIAAGRI